MTRKWTGSRAQTWGPSPKSLSSEMLSEWGTPNPSSPASICRCFAPVLWVSIILHQFVLCKKAGISSDFVLDLLETWLYHLDRWLNHLIARSRRVHLADILGCWREQNGAELWLFLYVFTSEARDSEEWDFIVTHWVRVRFQSS